MPTSTKAPKAAAAAAAPVKAIEDHNSPKKHVAPHQIIHSKNAAGNISEYPVEFTKDSK